MAKTSFKNQVSGIFKRREFGIVAVILIIMLAIGLRNPTFFTMENWKDILMPTSILIIVAIGQMMTMITGGIDLSVGSIVAFSGMSIGLIMIKYPSLHVIILILIGTAIGLMAGFINGIIIGKGRVPPLITTLATLAIYRGLVVVVSKSQWVVYGDITPGFKLIARGNILGINNLIIAAAVLSIIFYYFLGHTKKGREIYAYGGNKEAANFVGINSERINYLVYSLSGALAGFGGVLWVSRVLVAQSTSAKGFEFLTITACVVGGVSIFGGIGTVIGVILGALLLGIILNGLELIGVSDFWKMSIQGLVILLAVIIDTVLSRRVMEQLRKGRRIFNAK